MQEEKQQSNFDLFYKSEPGQLASKKLEQGGLKLGERLLVGGAKALWPVFQLVNKIHQGEPFKPKWAPAPLLKKKEKTFPQLGWPRQTDSLCPKCVKEAREEIVSGVKDYTHLINENPGEIKATIAEVDGKIMMIKDCPKHGKFEDVMAIDPEFLKRIEKLYPGRDFKAPLTNLRNHGTSSIQYGRGSVLTVDLTNRCNMMCDPCFMDANQVGYVHELSWDEVKEILDNSLKIEPRRQMSVQFSGGEPTLSPYFIDAIKYCKQVGYFSVQAATNGIRFAEDPAFAQEAYDAGMRIAYLQFDGVGNENNEHRKISNLFDVKLRAITNLYNAGIDVVLVVTIVNSINDHQVGPIVDFAIQNSDKITFVSFQPVSFTGRDEDVDDETRKRQRYTLSHLAHDVKKQTGISEPLRDWFPLSAIGPISDLSDMLQGPDQDFGNLKCGCHPNCGTGMALMVDKWHREWLPLTEFVNLEQFLEDVQEITDAFQPNWLTKIEVATSLLRNFNPSKAPKEMKLSDLLQKFDKQSGGGLDRKIDYGQGHERKKDRWHFMFVAGMWFQDLFNYDFRRTEMCIIPYGTQLGEISFCAYNTGIGWRQIIENMFKNASVADWYRKYGRHGVFAGNRPMPLPEWSHAVRLPEEEAKKAVMRPTSEESCGTGCGCH
ncbi:MAG: radical SAM protein [Deltaproteobacteria bacterium]|nr:MAG: radical SAM protein [Deltaproteobacteria bacterium]